MSDLDWFSQVLAVGLCGIFLGTPGALGSLTGSLLVIAFRYLWNR